jgi:TPR repeat protein
MIIEEDTNYAYILEHCTNNISFNSIKQLNSNFTNQLSTEQQDELFNKLNRGVNELGTEPLMSQYFVSYGNMHQAKLNYAFDQIPKDFFNYDKIRIIDYGCGQAIGEMIYKDYLNKNNITQNVAEIILIDQSEKCLARAALHSKVFYPISEITTIKKCLNDLTEQDISNKSYLPTLHIFSNVLDIETINLKHLTAIINNTMNNIYNQFVCVGPNFNSGLIVVSTFSLDSDENVESKDVDIDEYNRTGRLHSLSKLISNVNKNTIYEKDFEKNEFVLGKQWTCSVCVFNNIVRQENIEEQLITRLQRVAEQGDANAQYNLGKYYYNGDTIKRDYEQAVYWYKQAAEQDNADAQYNLGKCYEYGYGVEKNCEQATYWYKKAVCYWKRLAEQGEVEAQYKLGLCYRLGNGVEKDDKQVVYWYKKAAEQGFIVAQYELGFCYFNAMGVDKDYDISVYWYKKAAEQDYMQAQYNLGSFYDPLKYYGERDSEQAVYWYSKAGDQGDRTACCRLADLYMIILKQYQKAIYWYIKSHRDCDGDIQYKIGVCYDKQSDYEQAVNWFKKVAKRGGVYAQCILSLYYENGKGVEKNKEQAEYWFNKAAEYGAIFRQYCLGECYYKGQGIEQDYKKAISYYNKVVEKEYMYILYAHYKMGIFYYIGKGVKQDYKTAKFWWRESIPFWKKIMEENVDNQFNIGESFNDSKNIEENYEQIKKTIEKMKYSLDMFYKNNQNIERDNEQEVEYYRRIALSKYVIYNAKNRLGECYYNEKDYINAVYWWKEAAKQGDIEAQNNLGECFYKGQGVKQNYEQAVYWWKEAARQGDEKAQYNLGKCFYEGQGVEQNYEQAVYWYKKAAELGDENAQYNLGLCYEKGKGVEINVDKAKNLWGKSARQGYKLAKVKLDEYNNNNIIDDNLPF